MDEGELGLEAGRQGRGGLAEMAGSAWPVLHPGEALGSGLGCHMSLVLQAEALRLECSGIVPSPSLRGL